MKDRMITVAAAIAFTIGAAGFAATPAMAASGTCPSQTTIYGTVREVTGKTLLVRTVGVHGYESVVADDAKINYNYLKLRSGVFVGANGCLNASTKKFDASELTLSYDAATYPTNKRYVVAIEGVVREIHRGRLLVETGEPHGFVNVIISDADRFKVGQEISATGSFIPDGTFSALRIGGNADADSPSRVQTLSGVVREIHRNELLVQTGPPHGYVKILKSDISGLKVGERIQFTGSFNTNGSFSASSVEVTP